MSLPWIEQFLGSKTGFWGGGPSFQHTDTTSSGVVSFWITLAVGRLWIAIGWATSLKHSKIKNINKNIKNNQKASPSRVYPKKRKGLNPVAISSVFHLSCGYTLQFSSEQQVVIAYPKEVSNDVSALTGSEMSLMSNFLVHIRYSGTFEVIYLEIASLTKSIFLTFFILTTHSHSG